VPETPPTPPAGPAGSPPPRSFGVFKPTGHVVLSFPSADHARAAAHKLQAAGVADDAVHAYTDAEMLRQIDVDRQHASALASVGQELNLVLAHRALAARGYHWLVVRAADDALQRQVADIARACGAERAQAYGRFVIEELIVRDSDLPQVGESPDRGLDAQTPGGTEAERAGAPVAPAPPPAPIPAPTPTPETGGSA
jgi:hypothetical protein